MGLLSSSVSITRYRVEGAIEEPVNETVLKGLKDHIIADIDQEPIDIATGWTSFEHPYHPVFDDYRFVIGTQYLFSMRIDKKALSSKILKNHLEKAFARRLAETGREFLSKSEKTAIRDQVRQQLWTRIPPTPNMYDLIWHYETGDLWFFTNLKAANEELETLFSRSFKLTLIRLFPYTMADLMSGLKAEQRDRLAALTPTRFAG